MLHHEAPFVLRLLSIQMTRVPAETSREPDVLAVGSWCYIMARAITTILCDLDGTLIDSRRDITLAFQYALRCVVEGALPDETAIAQHIGKPLAHMAGELGYPLSPAQLTIFLDTYRSRYAAFCTYHTRPYPGVTTTLHALSSLTFGVVTTKAQEQAEMVLRQLQLASFFQHIQGWIPGLQLKPAPDAVIAALAALRCAPQQALMVGDTTADILAGKAAGLKTCAVTYGFGSLEELQHCQPDYVIDTFSDLVRLVEAPEQS
jgi:phosphoglycolate phosphatase